MGVGIDAIEKMSEILGGSLDYQRDIIKAFCNWARTQEISDGKFLSVLASIQGLTVGVLAHDEGAMETGLYLATTQIREVAAITRAAKLAMIAAHKESD